MSGSTPLATGGATPPSAGGRARRRMLLVAAVIAVGVAVAIVRPGFRDTAESSAGPSNRAGQTGTALPDVPVVDLKLERLQAEQGELEDAARNPFRFRPKPPPPPPPRAAAPMRRPEDFAPPPPPGPPPVPPIPVKFMGVMTTGSGVRVAHFTDTRGGTFRGKEGDIIEGRYRLLRIEQNFVEMAYLDGRGRQTIQMTGQ